VSICFMCADAIAIYHDAMARRLRRRDRSSAPLWVTSFTTRMVTGWTSRVRRMFPRERVRRSTMIEALHAIAHQEGESMKAYVMTTGAVFGLIVLAHLARMVAEGSHVASDPFFVLLTLPRHSEFVAWRLLRRPG